MKRLHFRVDFMNFKKKDLTGFSYYELIYPDDVRVFAIAINDLFTKSHCQTPYYRLIGRDNTVSLICNLHSKLFRMDL